MSATFGPSPPQYMQQDMQSQVHSNDCSCERMVHLLAASTLTPSSMWIITLPGVLQGKMKRPRESRRTLKRLPQDIRHQLEQLQVPPELLANPKVGTRHALKRLLPEGLGLYDQTLVRI